MVISGCGSSIDSFEGHIKSGDYSKAVDKYISKIAGNSTSENTVKTFLQEYLDENLSEYSSGNISEQDFDNRYSTVEKVNENIMLLDDIDTIYQRYLNLKESKSSYAEGLELSDAGELDEAIEAFSNVDSEDIENFESAQNKLSEIIQTYQNEIIDNSKQLATNGNFEEAVRCVAEAENVVGKTTELESLISEIYTQKYADSIENAYVSEDYLSVIQYYEEASDNDYVVISEDMTLDYSSSVTNYLNDINERAETAFGDEKDYSAAIDVLRAAISEVGDDADLLSELEQKRDYYKQYIPIPLTSLEYTQKTDVILIGGAESEDAKDVNGIQYDASTVIRPEAGKYADVGHGHVIYNLNLEYSSLSGVLYRPYRSLSYSNPDGFENLAEVKIYGDDVLLYDSPRIDTDVYDSFEISVDVTGVRNLKIEMYGVWTSNQYYEPYHPMECLAELMLQK